MSETEAYEEHDLFLDFTIANAGKEVRCSGISHVQFVGMGY